MDSRSDDQFEVGEETIEDLDVDSTDVAGGANAPTVVVDGKIKKLLNPNLTVQKI